jgi:hypothetical protein
MKPPLELLLLCSAFAGAAVARLVAHRANQNGGEVAPNNATVAGFFLGPVVAVLAIPTMVLMLVFLAILCLFAANEQNK